MADDKFSLTKWFFSLIPASGEQWGKWLDYVWKGVVIWAVIVFVVLPIKERFSAKKTPEIGVISGGKVDNSSNKKEKNSIIGIF